MQSTIWLSDDNRHITTQQRDELSEYFAGVVYDYMSNWDKEHEVESYHVRPTHINILFPDTVKKSMIPTSKINVEFRDQDFKFLALINVYGYKKVL